MINCICVIVPLIGGGTERYVKEMSAAWSEQGYIVLLVQYVERIINITVMREKKIVSKKQFFQDGTWRFWQRIEKKFNIQLVHVNHFIYANDLLFELYEKLTMPLFFTLHDYYTICPQINMFIQGSYCGEKGEEYCKKCLNNGLNNDFHKADKIDIVDYRKTMNQKLHYAKKIFVPSCDMQKRILRYFSDLPIYVRYNPEMQKIPDNLKTGSMKMDTEHINIGIIGFLTDFKGVKVLMKCAQIAYERKSRLEFIVFGETENNKLRFPPNVKILGKYEENEIYSLINKQKIDFCWFPSQCPETYSYVLSIPAKMHIPSLGTNLGAIGERITCNKWGRIYPFNLEETKIVDVLCQFDYKNFAFEQMKHVEQENFPEIEEFYGLHLAKSDTSSRDINSNMLDFLDAYDRINNLSTISWQEYTILRELGIKKNKLLWHLDKKTVLKKISNKVVKKFKRYVRLKIYHIDINCF
jgi:glycosyltransferase involved in cell wall biosynthesis